MMKTTLSINFWLSVTFSIAGGIATFWVPDLLTPDPESLYGPLRNNLIWVIVYLVLAQTALAYYAYSRGIRAAALYMGIVFLSVAAGLPFYGSMNAIPISEYPILGSIYVGLSHVAYFFAGFMPKRIENMRS